MFKSILSKAVCALEAVVSEEPDVAFNELPVLAAALEPHIAAVAVATANIEKYFASGIQPEQVENRAYIHQLLRRAASVGEKLTGLMGTHQLLKLLPVVELV